MYEKYKKSMVSILFILLASLQATEYAKKEIKNTYNIVINAEIFKKSVNKKTNNKKSVNWNGNRNQEFIIPGRDSVFTFGNKEISFPICYEKKVFQNEPFTKREWSHIRNVNKNSDDDCFDDDDKTISEYDDSSSDEG